MIFLNLGLLYFPESAAGSEIPIEIGCQFAVDFSLPKCPERLNTGDQCCLEGSDLQVPWEENVDPPPLLGSL